MEQEPAHLECGRPSELMLSGGGCRCVALEREGDTGETETET